MINVVSLTRIRVEIHDSIVPRNQEIVVVYLESSREKLHGISGNLLIRFNERLAEGDPNSTSDSRVVVEERERSIFMKVRIIRGFLLPMCRANEIFMLQVQAGQTNVCEAITSTRQRVIATSICNQSKDNFFPRRENARENASSMRGHGCHSVYCTTYILSTIVTWSRRRRGRRLQRRVALFLAVQPSIIAPVRRSDFRKPGVPRSPRG